MPTTSTPLSPADIAAHAEASYVRRPRQVLARVPAGHPRGSWPAEQLAAAQGADVVMDLDSDDYLVLARAVEATR